LAQLQRTGSRGVTQLDFTPPVCDGLAPILRVASRIAELRAQGHAIIASRERTPGGAWIARYTLAEPAPPATTFAQEREGPPEQTTLDLGFGTAHQPASALTADLDGGAR
jgi:hypothetical protein